MQQMLPHSLFEEEFIGKLLLTFDLTNDLSGQVNDLDIVKFTNFIIFGTDTTQRFSFKVIQTLVVSIESMKGSCVHNHYFLVYLVCTLYSQASQAVCTYI